MNELSYPLFKCTLITINKGAKGPQIHNSYISSIRFSVLILRHLVLTFNNIFLVLIFHICKKIFYTRFLQKEFLS